MTVKRLLCEECWEEVDATYETRHHVEDVRGVTVEVDIEHLICPKCGNSIGWAPLVDEGFDKLYRAYREKMGIMQPEEIVIEKRDYLPGLMREMVALTRERKIPWVTFGKRSNSL